MSSRPTEQQLREYLGTLELQIMQAVWAMGPSTVNDVLDRLNNREGRDLVYNTVMSTMGRLHDKGYLTRKRDGKAYVYSGSGPVEFIKDRIAESARDQYGEHGQVALAGFTEGLDEQAKIELRQLLDDN